MRAPSDGPGGRGARSRTEERDLGYHADFNLKSATGKRAKAIRFLVIGKLFVYRLSVLSTT